MKCNYPLIRAETYETYTNKQGGISYKVEWLERNMFDKMIGTKEFSRERLSNRYRKITPVGCGQCIPCLLGHSAQWATRIMLQVKYGYDPNEWSKKPHKHPLLPYPDGTCWFLTFTYKDEYLKTHKYANPDTGEIHEGISLYKKDMQNFWKRLRKAYPKMKIKYYECGEYGSQTMRPHYHAIVFGLPLETDQFIKTGMSQKFNTPRWKLQKLTEIWGMGLVDIGRVTWNSAGYVARYTLKKATNGKNPTWYQAQGMLPEFVTMSNGIAKDYFLENLENIYATDSVPISDAHGRIQKPPKSYDRMLKEMCPELYDSIKRKRKKNSESLELGTRQTTDLTPEERRAISEARMASVIKDMRMEV